MIGVAVAEDNRANTLKIDLQCIDVVQNTPAAYPSVEQYGSALVAALDLNQRRKAVFGQRQHAIDPVFREGEALCNLCPGHQNVDEIIHNDCDTSLIDF